MRRLTLLVALVAFPVALDARAASFVLPLAPDSPRPSMVYTIRADDGATTYTTQARVEAVSGFTEIVTGGIPGDALYPPVASVLAMQFSYPTASFDLTIGGADQIPFSITIDATTERVEHDPHPPLLLASFGLALDGEQTSSIDSKQSFQREGFDITLQSGSSVFTQSGGADCFSADFPGCVGGTFTGTIDASAFELTRLEFLGGGGEPRDPLDYPLDFALGTDGLGITWMIAVSTEYRGTDPQYGSSESPLVFVPEPGTAALLALGLVVLGLRRRPS